MKDKKMVMINLLTQKPIMPIPGGSVFMTNCHALEIVGIEAIQFRWMIIWTIIDVRSVKNLSFFFETVRCKAHVQDEMMIVKGTLVVMKANKIATNLCLFKRDIEKWRSDYCISWFGRRINNDVVPKSIATHPYAV